jgi:hypothetical protein
MDEWTNGRMDEWTNGRMDEWTNGRMDEWTNGRMDDIEQELRRTSRPGVRLSRVSE